MTRRTRLQLLYAAAALPALAGAAAIVVRTAAPAPFPAPAVQGPARAPAQEANGVPAPRVLGLGEEAGWSPVHGPAAYRSEDIEIRVRAVGTDGDEGYEALLIQPGRAPLAIRTGATPSIGCCTVTVGRLDRSGRRYVMLGSFTGGLHCCWRVQIALPDGPRRHVLDLGAHDAAPNLGDDVTGVRDMDGDGRVDFVFGDDAFLYRFASYSGSSAPLQILNVVAGRVVDVSGARRYRRLHEREMETLRQACREGVFGQRNAACAAYVASAARIGRFEDAWGEMLRSHHRGDVIDGATFPDRLRRFLIDRGYIGPAR
jgi:hypothetical protein